MKYSDELVEFVVMNGRQGRAATEIAKRARDEFTQLVTAREVRVILATMSVKRTGEVVQRERNHV